MLSNQVTPSLKVNASAATSTQEYRLVPLDEVMNMTGIGKTHIYSLMKSGGFPAPVKIRSASRWVQAEIQCWIRKQISERDALIAA